MDATNVNIRIKRLLTKLLRIAAREADMPFSCMSANNNLHVLKAFELVGQAVGHLKRCLPEIED
jgi:hypothetical protein